MRGLQRQIGEWHRARFPEAGREHVALKLCEEAGEVARAINGDCGKNSATGYGATPQEVADVIIAALVLMDRWYSEYDLTTLIENKLEALTTPGAHRASLIEG
jgi:NTP pyrophosphatase (non-canonical NTP hydrolase)